MPEDEPSPLSPSSTRGTLDTFDLGPGASAPIASGSRTPIENIVEFFEEEIAARWVMQALERDEIVPRLKAALRERKSELRRQVAFNLARELFITYTMRYSKAQSEENWEPFENAQLAGEGKSPTEETLQDAGADTWTEDPPAPLQSIAEDLLQQDRWDTWAERCATPALERAAWNFHQFHDPPQTEGAAGREWEARFRKKIEAGELLEPVSLLSKTIANVAVYRFNKSAEGEGLSPLQIERLWGLHDEDDAPAPRESPNPFDMATGLAKVPTGELTRGNLQGISGEGEWLEDSFGRPVYSYTFQGPPWGGNAQLSVKQVIETDAAWKMLRDGKGDDRPAQFHADAVTLYYLFLAYASDQAPKDRPGADGAFRIKGEDVLRILNLPDNGEWDRQRKVRHIYNLNSYLNSFQIQLNRITYQGKRKRTEAISPAQLWDTYLRGVREEDLYGNVTNMEFGVEGREGAWADLFLHDSDTWTPFGSLPIRVLEDMDGRNRYSRLILFHILILFRVVKGTVKRTGDDLLKWCRVVPDELSRQQISRRRSTIQNALEELKHQGFRIDDSRLRAAKGAPLSDWQGQAVYFYPPPDIVEACPQIEAPEGQLPEPRSETWTGKRVRDLRKHIGEYQSEFGKRLPNREGGTGVKQPRVSTIESGDHLLTERQEKKLDELAKESGFEG